MISISSVVVVLEVDVEVGRCWFYGRIGLELTDTLGAFRPAEDRVRTFLGTITAQDTFTAALDPVTPGFDPDHVVFSLDGSQQSDASAPFQATYDLAPVSDGAALVVDALEGVVAAVAGREVGPCVLADVPPAAWGDLARVLGQFASDVTAHLAVETNGGRNRALLLKMAALLHDVGKPETWSQGEDGRIHFYNHEPVGARIAATRLQALRFGRDEVKRVHVMVEGHLRPAHLARAEKVTRRAVYRYFRATGDAGVEVALLSLADRLATWGPHLQEYRWPRHLEVAEMLLTHYLERYEETIAPPPLVTGHDLMAELGLEPGPEIGRLLEALREAQAAGEVGTREEALALARQDLRTMNSN